MIRLLYIFSIFAIPFSDFLPLLPLGEMEHELSTYLFLLTLAGAMFHSMNASNNRGYERFSIPQAKLITRMFFLLMGVILISFVMNFPIMLGERFRGRYAPAKFITSTMVVIYGFAIAYLTFFLSKKNPWHELIVRPISASVFVCTIIGIIEIFSWDGGFTASFYEAISKFIHMGSEESAHAGFIGGAFGWGHTEGRARAVSFEPPALANFAGLAWPWVYAGFAASRGGRKALYFLLWLACNGLMIMAASRTGILLLSGNFAVLFLLRFVYLPPRHQRISLSRIATFALWCATTAIVAGIFLKSDDIAASIAGGESISNISRYASITTAFRMFFDTPIWGYGFGQYGFHVLDYMPGWGYLSWEIRAWFTDPMVVWPPVFSLYARLAAETGMLGLAAWIGIWYWLSRQIVKTTLAYQKATGLLLLRSYPLIISCFSILFAGIASDTLHQPLIWVTLGLCCSYIQQVKEKSQAMVYIKNHKQEPVPTCNSEEKLANSVA